MIGSVAVLLSTCSDSGDQGSLPLAGETVVTHRAADLQWETDWDTALARARTEDKVVLVNFYADWCIWCKRLDSTTLKDADVSRLLASRCVPLKLEIDGGGRLRARELRVDAPPTTIFIDPDDGEIGRILGYSPPTAFLGQLERILRVG
jgi:thiol:disulfide interchange protein